MSLLAEKYFFSDLSEKSVSRNRIQVTPRKLKTPYKIELERLIRKGYFLDDNNVANLKLKFDIFSRWPISKAFNNRYFLINKKRLSIKQLLEVASHNEFLGSGHFMIVSFDVPLTLSNPDINYADFEHKTDRRARYWFRKKKQVGLHFKQKSLARPLKFYHFDENTKAFSQKYVHNFTKLIKGSDKHFSKKLELNFRRKHRIRRRRLYYSHDELLLTKKRIRKGKIDSLVKFKKANKLIPIIIFEKDKIKHYVGMVVDRKKKKNLK